MDDKPRPNSTSLDLQRRINERGVGSHAFTSFTYQRLLSNSVQLDPKLDVRLKSLEFTNKRAVSNVKIVVRRGRN